MGWWIRTGVLISSAAFGAVACSAATEGPAPAGEVPGTRVSLEALAGGCHVNCPACPPGKVCSMQACTLECPPDKKPCGNGVCGAGEYCCNESCGICAPEGGFCTEQYCAPSNECLVMAKCIEGYVWDAKLCKCRPDKKGECTSDADCRLEADYCTGCDCAALSSKEKLPACSGPGVKCFADPCLGQVATCLSGQCVVGAL